MVERIRALLQARQLTPTQFADAIGIARPIVSHILSGRNKPSLEVVQKIIGAFPDLSLPWLLNGQGPMLPVITASMGSRAVEAATQPGGVSEAPEGSAKRAKVAAPLVTAVTNDIADLSPPVSTAQPLPREQPVIPAVPAPDAIQPASQPVVFPAPAAPAESRPIPAVVAAPNPVNAFVEPGKKIRRIVIFYQDGTFGDFLPE